jgi:hypothetical protein
MSRSKKISIGFQVVDVRTDEAPSPIFARREPARAAANEAYRAGRNCGVRHLEEYVAADASKEEIAARRSAALAMPPGTRGAEP